MAKNQSTRAFGLAVRVMLGCLCGLALGRAGLRHGWPFLRYEVADHSMVPTLAPGDRLLVVTWPWLGGRPRRGELVVLRDPEGRVAALVKRVAALPGEPWTPSTGSGYVVEGDAGDQSRDSRSFGRVPESMVIGRVIWRYLPAERRGPVR